MYSTQLSFFDENPNPANFISRLHDFYLNNNSPKVIKKNSNDIPYFIGEFWTAKQRQGNSLHEISYRACFKPQLPEFFISRLTDEGDCVYDPFMGRGTTPLQAALMGRKAIGNDINPLATMLVRPRFNPPAIEEIYSRLQEIDWSKNDEIYEDLLVFYHPNTLKKLQALRLHFLGRQLDHIDDWIRMVAINRLTGHSSGFFSVYSMPPNQAVSVKSQMKINTKRNQTPPERDISEIIIKKSRSLLKQAYKASEQGRFFTCPANNTPEIKANSVDLVVTSPPFLDVVQYATDNWLRCWFAGIDVGSVKISMHKKIAEWQEFVRSTFEELARVVKNDGHIAFEVGEVRGGKVELDKIVLAAIRGLPFEPMAVIVNSQNFTKTANCWGVSNNKSGTNSNRIVVLRKTDD